VLDAGNNVIKTVDISIPNGYTMMDTQIKALANGGFVVAWSQVDTANYSDYSVHYAIYDNSGNLQSSNTLAALVPGSPSRRRAARMAVISRSPTRRWGPGPISRKLSLSSTTTAAD
jgi:hypothetical protein